MTDTIFFPKFVPEWITVYGIGGVGANLAHYLGRYMTNSGYLQTSNLRLVDRDVIETKNLIRQPFFPYHKGRLKADIICREIAAIFANVTQVPEYITADSIQREVGVHYHAPSLIYLAVDNHFSRKVIIDGFFEHHRGDFLIVMIGNELHTYGLDVFGRIGNRFYGIDQRLLQPELANPTDTGPREATRCTDNAEVVTTSAVQIASANRAAANVGAMVLEQIMRNNQIVTKIIGDVRNISQLGSEFQTIGVDGVEINAVSS